MYREKAQSLCLMNATSSHCQLIVFDVKCFFGARGREVCCFSALIQRVTNSVYLKSTRGQRLQPIEIA